MLLVLEDLGRSLWLCSPILWALSGYVHLPCSFFVAMLRKYMLPRRLGSWEVWVVMSTRIEGSWELQKVMLDKTRRSGDHAGPTWKVWEATLACLGWLWKLLVVKLTFLVSIWKRCCEHLHDPMRF